MKILHLTLRKKWFDMIESGEKKEEYREIKPYWITRLCKRFKSNTEECNVIQFESIKYDAVTFVNGYGKSAPRFTVKFEMLVVRKGFEKWGAEPGKEYFVIKLGEKILKPLN